MPFAIWQTCIHYKSFRHSFVFRPRPQHRNPQGMKRSNPHKQGLSVEHLGTALKYCVDQLPDQYSEAAIRRCLPNLRNALFWDLANMYTLQILRLVILHFDPSKSFLKSLPNTTKEISNLSFDTALKSDSEKSYIPWV